MRCLINWARRHNGRSLLRDQSQLDRSASIRGNDIRRCQDFSHTACGQPFVLAFSVVGYFVSGVSLVKAPSLFGRRNVSVWVAQFGHRDSTLHP